MAITLVIMLAVLALPASAHAASSATPYGGKTVYVQAGQKTPTGVVAQTYTACNLAGLRRDESNIYGAVLWSYFQEVWWCWNGSWITTNSRGRRGQTYVWPWSFQGHTSSGHYGGDGQWQSYWFTEGLFCMSTTFGCVNNRYPSIWIRVYGNGAVQRGWA